MELRLALKERSAALVRTVELQTAVDNLEKKLSSIIHDLDTASGSAGVMHVFLYHSSKHVSLLFEKH